MTIGTVFLGTIILSCPEFGLALVTSAEGSADTKQLFLAHLPLNDATTGAVRQANYVDGTAVVCLRNANAPDKAYILAPANYAVGDVKDTAYGRQLYNVTDFKENESTAFITILENMLQGKTIDFQNFAHGADNDALPGDSDIIDINGNAGIHVGRYLAQLRGSPAAFIDVSNITNAIRLIAEKTEQHLPLSVVLAGKELEVHDIAVTEAESFGLKDGNPLTISDDEIVLTEENAIPLYRLQEAAGAAIDGKEELVVGFPDNNKHDKTAEPPILAKKRTALSGAIEDASANGILSIKSPAIKAIHQVAYDKEGDQTEQQDILQPYEYESGDDPEQPKADIDDQISDAAINKLIDTLFTGDYLGRLKEKMAEHGLKVSTDDGLLGNRIKANGKFKPGPTTDYQYGLPDFITLTDPVTGKSTTYYATTSFISQEPDGSILICDGYGSEIRMSRGNIYISPALDLYFRPGRDLSAMVPRHQSYNAQADTTINAAGSIYVRAVKDLRMVGATGANGAGGTGLVTLECAATGEPTAQTGLMLKSKSGATFVGSDIYIGINTCTGMSDSIIDTPKRPGTIVIDACTNGALNLRSQATTIDSYTTCLVACNSQATSGTGITMNPYRIGVFAPEVDMPALLNMVGGLGTEQLRVVRNGETQYVTMNVNTTPWLRLEGPLQVGGQLDCNSFGRFCDGVAANGVISTSNYCGIADTSNGRKPFEKSVIAKRVIDTGFGEIAATRVSYIAKSIYQDSYVSKNGFAFPDNYGVLEGIRIPGMLWQTANDDLQVGDMWSEPVMLSADSNGPMSKTTMCYPGFRVWNTAMLSQKGYTTVSLSNGYRTNTTKEKING